MAVATTDLALLLSGGATNTDQNLSLGGVKSSVDVISGGLNSIFRDITNAEAASGITIYRCLYLQNNNASDTASAVRMHIQSPSTSLDSLTSMGVGAVSVNTNEATIASESTAPLGVTFTSPTDLSSGILLGDLAPGDFRSLWVALTISANAGYLSPDSVTWRFSFNP